MQREIHKSEIIREAMFKPMKNSKQSANQEANYGRRLALCASRGTFIRLAIPAYETQPMRTQNNHNKGESADTKRFPVLCKGFGLVTPRFSEIVLIVTDFPSCLKDLAWPHQEFLLKTVICPFFRGRMVGCVCGV
jgi:hypothetical protein